MIYPHPARIAMQITVTTILGSLIVTSQLLSFFDASVIP